MSDPIDLAIRPCLIVRAGDAVDIPAGGEIVLGRDTGCQVVIEEEAVSRRHARVFRRDNQCFVEDLGSQNGTFVRETRVTGAQPLADNDVIVIGSTRLLFALDQVPRTPPVIVANLDPAIENLVSDPGSSTSRQMRRLRSVLSIAEGLTTLTDVAAVARHVLAEVLAVVQAERGLILVTAGAGELRPLAALLGDGTDDPESPYSRTILRTVMDQRVGLLTQDAQQDGRLQKTADGKPVASIQVLGMRSVICVPMVLRDKLLGVLQISNSTKQAFTADDLRLLTGVARLAALAFESARMHQERQKVVDELTVTQMHLRSRVEQFRLLYQLEHQLSTSQDLGTFLGSVARQAVSSLGGEAGAIFLLDEETGRISFAYPAGGMEREVKHQTFAPGRGFVGHVISTGQPVLENAVPSSPHFDPELAKQFGVVPQNLLAVPLVIADEQSTKAIGALEVLNKKSGPFTSGDQQLLTFLAAQIASALMRMRLQDERTKRERLATIGTMAASIAHDFGTPLQMISGFVDILESKEVARPDRDRMLRGMRTYVNRIANMVTELLEFARGEGGFRPQWVTIRSFLEDIVSSLEPEVAAGSVQLVTRLEYDGRLLLDPDRMRRVIFNLVNNALSAMDADRGGTLTISCRAVDGGMVELEVADTGPGIPQEIRARLFAPFATFGKKHGTGLGLSIAQRIVSAHGGTIAAQDAAPRGTRFIIRVPA